MSVVQTNDGSGCVWAGSVFDPSPRFYFTSRTKKKTRKGDLASLV